jgi:predicted DNA-binding transcriptional regulator AlpA|tara:strand:+ start:1158 stop:1334 length:177 start_codon:yes stop_codon:yes gene_type:complete
MNKKIIRLSEAAQILGVSEAIFRRKHLKELEPEQLWPGGPYFFLRSDVQSYAREKTAL